MIIILDDQPIPIKVDLTDVPTSQPPPRRIKMVRTYALRQDGSVHALPQYVFVSEHYEA